MALASFERPPSMLVAAAERAQEQISAVEEAIYHPSDSRSGVAFGGMAEQTIDDINELVGHIRTIQLNCASMLEAIESHLAPKGLTLVEDSEENDCLALGYIAHADGRRILRAGGRRLVMEQLSPKGK